MKNALLTRRGFVPLTFMVFLNAFIDLGHKITIQNTVFKLYDGNQQIILTAIVNAFILLPYIFFFRSAGKTSDRFNKAKVLRITSASVVLIMLLISLSYYAGWFWTAFLLTLLLALQSAYYGPAKLGYLKELVSNEQLQGANGIVQSVLMIAILAGILVFSALFEQYFDERFSTPTQVIQAMTPLALILCMLAIIEAALAWRLPLTTTAQEQPQATQKLRVLLQSPSLLPVIIGLCVFWSVGQMLLAVYPSFAKDSMGISNAMQVQAILAMIAIGIMLGSLLDSVFSRCFIELKLLPVASLLVFITSVLLPFNLSVHWAFVLFLIMGIAGGVMVVPLNALLQFCSDRRYLGDTIAGANLMQNIAMLSCLALTVFFSFYTLKAAQLLLLISLITAVGLAVMLYLMPQSLNALLHPQKIQVHGFNLLTGNGAVIFLAKSVDTPLFNAIQASYPRKLQTTFTSALNEHSVVLMTEKEWQWQLSPKSLAATLYWVELKNQQLSYKPYQNLLQ